MCLPAFPIPHNSSPHSQIMARLESCWKEEELVVLLRFHVVWPFSYTTSHSPPLSYPFGAATPDPLHCPISTHLPPSLSTPPSPPPSSPPSHFTPLLSISPSPPFPPSLPLHPPSLRPSSPPSHFTPLPSLPPLHHSHYSNHKSTHIHCNST